MEVIRTIQSVIIRDKYRTELTLREYVLTLTELRKSWGHEDSTPTEV